MKNVRIYQPGSYQPGSTLELSDNAGQHVGVVLRMQAGERLTLFCGNDYEYSATIQSAHKKKVVVRIDNAACVSRESPQAIHLAQALSKGDRMEWVVQKAVELGVASITPIISQRSVVRLDNERMAKKEAQWQAIAIAACEQCGRNTLPIIFPTCTFNEFVQKSQAQLKLILHPESALSWRTINFTKQDAAVLIGPEGGLAHDEVELAKANQFVSLKLGPRVLRTETAAITALSVLQAAGGDL